MLWLGYIIYWVGAVADWKTTKRGLKRGGKEVAPAAKWLNRVTKNADLTASILKLGVFLMWFFIGVPWWAYVLAGALQLVVAANNHFGWLKR